MGNHTVGKAMGKMAEQLVTRRRSSESALELLDVICEPYRGHDAEFESEDPAKPGYVHPEFDRFTDPHPKAALGMLLVEAFAPRGLADIERYAPMLDGDSPDEEVACDAWYAEVYDPFHARYDFC